MFMRLSSTPARAHAPRGRPLLAGAMPSAAWWHELAAGGVAGVGSRLVTYPLDTLKAQQQVWGELARLGGRPAGRAPRAPGAGGGGGGAVLQMDLAGAARRVWRAEGARGFYRGFGAVAVGAFRAERRSRRPPEAPQRPPSTYPRPLLTPTARAVLLFGARGGE